jgi:membrane protease YdiL (CAAX protease family)
MMEKFILNRPDDFKTLSRKKIIGTTLKWFVLLMVGAMLLRIVCVVIYMSQGVNPMELTKFAGDPTTRMDHASWKTIAHLMIVAPVLEEVMFRLGLSFKRTIVALWVGLLPVVCAYYMHHCRVWYILVGLVVVGALLFWLVYHFTTDDQWKVWRKKYVIPAMWISAISFGLVHFMAFTVLNWQVLPFAITTVLVPMAGGCAVTYARVNLGFWWGVLLHCIINIPAVLIIASAM